MIHSILIKFCTNSKNFQNNFQMSCIIRNPHPFFLKGCTAIGILLGSVGIPYAAFKTFQHLEDPVCKLLERPHSYNNPPIDQKPIKLSSDQEDQKRKFLFGDKPIPKHLILASANGLLGVPSIIWGVLFFKSSLNNFKNTYKSNHLIQTVCCKRIRFFAGASMIQGGWAAMALSGVFFIAQSATLVYDYYDGNPSIRGLFDTELYYFLKWKYYMNKY